ncbi:phosphoribosylglycinamide formyltransferase [Fructobacillus tropaeoli]|uniref:Phosphoribosylglycinamide formyltransferase n=1 Tax=Fructobacillus tropaeoli TaxID=709323 RepID=A0A3F3HHZ8_9LACO|nr:phosphoribosylglycinamide formyltransferase [Fructobacillus tropaeoli]GAP04853.1 phosphoribosylglycinamide formyltransferase [Fructobacillus tropaeoli]GIC70960.1 phosphoribosylglycinamide formyltransferase [Fructobacillus tropaeoli]CAK1253574.1 Folate-dependent phosphoribosylglycinamide formyltransferase PurN (PurN) [Fructobacillus tropaeoli]
MASQVKQRKARLAVFASGTGTNFSALQEAIVDKDLPAEIVLVVVDHQDAPVIERATKWNIPVFKVRYPSYESKAAAEQAIVEELQAHQVDGILLAGYMRILTETLLSAFPQKIVNLHPALLPKFPGRHSILDAYEAGVRQTGVTVHFIDNGIDTGPAIAQQAVPRLPEDSLEDLTERIHAVEHELYPAVLADLLEKGVFLQ